MSAGISTRGTSAHRGKAADADGLDGLSQCNHATLQHMTHKPCPRVLGSHRLQSCASRKVEALMPAKSKAHYAGTYQTRAKQLRAEAYADPMTRCCAPGCGKTLAEHPPGATWDAGHARSGDPTSPLQPEASTCNRSNGASEGNRRRLGLVPTRRW